jgi:hypothetical protein
MTNLTERLSNAFTAVLAELDIERYAAKRRADTNTMSLFDDEGNSAIGGKKWDEDLHPRAEKGNEHTPGGRFVKKEEAPSRQGNLFGSADDDNSSEKPDSSKPQGFQPKLLDQPKTIEQADAKIASQKATSEMRQAMMEEDRAKQRSEKVGQWRQAFTGSPREFTASGDLARHDWEKAIQNGVEPGRLAEIVDHGVANGVIDSKVGDHLKAKVNPSQPSNASKGFDELPDGVKSHVTHHVDILNEANKQIELAKGLDKKFGGGGRYEGEVREKFADKMKTSSQKLQEFMGMAEKNGFDGKGIIEGLGGSVPGAEKPAEETHEEKIAKAEAILRPKLKDLTEPELRELNKFGWADTKAHGRVGDPTALALEELTNRIDKPRIEAQKAQQKIDSVLSSQKQGIETRASGEAWSNSSLGRESAGEEARYLRYKDKGQGKEAAEMLQEFYDKKQVPMDKRLKEFREQAKPTPSPSLVMPETTVDNSQAKSGDQLGLFGEATKAKTADKPFVPTLLGKGEQTKGWQGSMFETMGNPDQMNLFSDGSEPEGMVQKPKDEPKANPTNLNEDRARIASEMAKNGQSKDAIKMELIKQGAHPQDATFIATKASTDAMSARPSFAPTLLDQKKPDAVAATATASDSSVDDAIQMYEDNIQMMKSQGRKVPSQWTEGLQKAKAKKIGANPETERVTDSDVYGHPENSETKPEDYGLVPLKIDAATDLGWRLDKVAKMRNEAGAAFGAVARKKTLTQNDREHQERFESLKKTEDHLHQLKAWQDSAKKQGSTEAFKPTLLDQKKSDAVTHDGRTVEQMRKDGLSEDQIQDIESNENYFNVIGDPSKASDADLNRAHGHAGNLEAHHERNGRKDMADSIKLERSAMKAEIKRRNEGPKDGDKDENGLVFRGGRWHREDEDIAEHGDPNYMPDVDYDKVAPHNREYAKADPKRWAKLVAANAEDYPNAEHNPLVRHEFQNGHLVAPIQQVDQTAARAKRRGYGEFKGYAPMDDRDFEAQIDSPFQHEVMADNHPRKVKFTHRMELKNALPNASKKLVTFAKRLTKAKFLEQYGDHSTAVQSSTGLPIGEFWKQVNNGPSAKEDPKPGDESPLFDKVKAEKSEGFKPKLLDQPKVDDGPKDGDRDENGLVFRNGRWHRDDEDKSPIPLRDRKSFAQKMAADGKTHSEIVDAMTSRGVAAVDARRNAANAVGDVAQGVVAAAPKVDDGPKDNAVVNLPLDKRGSGSLDSQIDKWKADTAKAAKEKRSSDAAKKKTDKAEARELFDKHAQALAEQTAAKHGVSAKEALKTIDDLVKWQPDKAKTMLSKFAEQSGASKPVPEVQPKAKATQTKTNMDFGEKIEVRKHLAKAIGPRVKKDLTEEEKVRKAMPEWRKRYDVAEDASKPGEYFIVDRITKEPHGDSQFTRAGSFSSLLAKRLGKQGKKPSDFVNFKDKESAEKQLEQIAVNRNHGVSSKKTDGETEYVIHRNVSERKRPVVKGGFKTRDEAEDYMEKNAPEIMEHEFPRYETYQYLDSVERSGGKDYRNGKDVDAEDFQKVFNSRAGVFGKWQSDKSGQIAFNHAFDGLHDLAEAIGMPPKAISLNGDLALGFGADGKGGKDAGRAHYDPSKRLINLTKMSGAGSLAHEWFHALDHHLAKLTAGKNTLSSTTGDLISSDLRDTRPELAEAILGVHKAIAAKTVTEAVTANDPMVAHRQKVHDDEAKELATAKEKDHYIVGARTVAGQLWNLRKDMIKSAGYKNKTVAPEVMKEFDDLAAKLSSFDTGKHQYKQTSTYGGYGTYDNLDALNAVYKKATGRSFHTKDHQSKGTDVYNAIKRHDEIKKRVALASEGATETKKKPTSFLEDARKLDEFFGLDYYSKREEMGARAFEAYIQDKLSSKGIKSQYLGAKAKNSDYPGSLRPFPHAEEREAINAAFDNLFKVLKHKPRSDEKGEHVELYSVNHDDDLRYDITEQDNRDAMRYSLMKSFGVTVDRYTLYGVLDARDRKQGAWDESKVNRHGKGNEHGGEFAPKSGGSAPVNRQPFAGQSAKAISGIQSFFGSQQAPAPQQPKPSGDISSRTADAMDKAFATRRPAVKPAPVVAQPKPAPKPQQAPQKPSRPQPAFGSSVPVGHHLHATNLPKDMQSSYRTMTQNLSEALGYDWKHAKTDQEFNEAFAKVDKKHLQEVLGNFNDFDKHARSRGIAFSDYVNANNGIHPQLAKRLSGGSRFFDRNKIANKINQAPKGFVPKVSAEDHKAQMADDLLKAIAPDQWQKKRAGFTYQDLGKKTIEGPKGAYNNPQEAPQREVSKPAKQPAQMQDPVINTAPNSLQQAPSPKPESHGNDWAGNRSLKRNFWAGHRQGSMEFENPLHQALYDIGSGRRKAMSGKSDQREQLISSVMQSTGMSRQDVVDQAHEAHTYGKEQMKGIGEGEHRKLAMNRPEVVPEAKHEIQGISKIASNKLDETIKKTLQSEDPELIADFRSFVEEAHKQLTDEAQSHNKVLRYLAPNKEEKTIAADGTVGTRVTSTLGLKVANARHVSKDADAMDIDEKAEDASNDPEHKWAFGGKGHADDQAYEMLTQGVRQVPNVYDEKVIERAYGLAGPAFMARLNGEEPGSQTSHLAYLDNTPFSWAAAIRRKRAEHQAWIDRYVGEKQLSFSWDEDEHPRQPKGSDHGGEFAKKNEVESGEIDRGYRSVVSGAQSSPSDISAYKLSNRPIGVSVQPRPISQRVVNLLVNHAKMGNDVFLDSGIASTVAKGEGVDFDKVFAKYREILEQVPASHRHRFMVVAPDHLEKLPDGSFRGDQSKTFDLQNEWAGEVKKIQNMGASVIVPVQRGEEDLPSAASIATDAIDFSNGNTILGIPYNKGAWDDESILKLAKVLKGGRSKLHILGGGKDKVEALTKKLHAIDPDIILTGDAASELRNRNRKSKPQVMKYRLDRYRHEVMIERYANERQMSFNWDENLHPRHEKGAEESKGGQFAPRGESLGSKETTGKQQGFDWAEGHKPVSGAKATGSIREIKAVKDAATEGNLKIRGVSKEVAKCDRCGRSHLGKTVKIEVCDNDGKSTGDFYHFGSDCVGTVMDMNPELVMRKAIEADYKRAMEEYRSEKRSKEPTDYGDRLKAMQERRDPDGIEGKPKESPKPARQLKEGYVEQPRAKAGGEISDVDGVFYKGGSLMPVHGLFSGQEKPEAKPKRMEGSAPIVKGDAEGGGLSPIRKRSEEEIEEVRKRQQRAKEWTKIRNSPIGRALHLKDSPHYIKWGHGVLDTWFAQAEIVGNDWMKRAADEAKKALLEKASEEDRTQEGIDWAIENREQEAASEVLMSRKQKKLRREFPDTTRAREYLNWFDSEDIERVAARMIAAANEETPKDKYSNRMFLARKLLAI